MTGVWIPAVVLLAGVAFVLLVGMRSEPFWRFPVSGEAVAVQMSPFPRGERAADARIIQRAKRAYFSFQTRSLTERRNICSRIVRGVSARS
jgi:hypothetical protein